MRLDHLVTQLTTEFRVTEFQEAWPQFGLANVGIAAFASPQFLAHGNGLMVQGLPDVAEVYTAVFPSLTVLDQVLARALPGSLLVCHHPLRYDGIQGYLSLSRLDLTRLRDRGVSVYALHAPLAFGERVSTWRALARKLGVEVEGTFRSSNNKLGCYGIPRVPDDLQGVFTFKSMVLRVESELEINNSQVIEHVDRAVGRVALVPGDGADPELVALADELGCHTYITGILDNPIFDQVVRARSQAFLDHARVRALNLVGASHYATEAPGLRVLATWFQALGLTAQFIPDKPELPEFLKGW